MCFIEPWEDITLKSIKEMKSRQMEFKLKDKYVSMCLYDENEDGDEEKFQEHRKIVSVDWVNRKGYQVVTNLIGSEDDPDLNEGYLINESLPPLIKAGKNPGVRLLFWAPTATTANDLRAVSQRLGGSGSAAAATAAADDDGDEELPAARAATADPLHVTGGDWQGGGD